MLVYVLATLTLLGFAPSQQLMGCETVGNETNSEAFSTLRGCLLYSVRIDGRDVGRPPNTASADELMKRTGFERERGSWTRQDSTGILLVRVTIEGRGITAFVTFTPATAEPIAQPILQHLLSTATEVESTGPASALQIRRKTEAPGQYDNCSSNDEFTVSLSGRLLRERYMLSCTK